MRSNSARAGVGIVLIALAAVLFFVLRDDDDGSDASAENIVAQEATGAAGPAGEPGPTNEQPEEPPEPLKPQIQTIEIKAGGPVGGVQEIAAKSGEQIRFKVRSDQEGEIHIHGYELTEPIEAGQSITLDFPADLEGAYEVELHSEPEFPIAELSVSP